MKKHNARALFFGRKLVLSYPGSVSDLFRNSDVLFAIYAEYLKMIYN